MGVCNLVQIHKKSGSTEFKCGFMRGMLGHGRGAALVFIVNNWNFSPLQTFDKGLIVDSWFNFNSFYLKKIY